MKEGTRVKVISGGWGAGCAFGIEGVVCSREEAISSYVHGRYNGEYTSKKAPLYIKGDNNVYYGLCKGYRVIEIVPVDEKETIGELIDIRNNLLIAIESNDMLLSKMYINKLDTLIYKMRNKSI